MRQTIETLILASAALAGSALAQRVATSTPDATVHVIERCDALCPDAAAMAWSTVPWRTTFGAAILDADDTDRPVLLWTMNGHPLGLT